MAGFTSFREHQVPKLAANAYPKESDSTQDAVDPTTRGKTMKGVVLAGGLGTRLYPLTRITNKHLLPVYDKPMIYYPLQILVDAGITEIMVVTGGNSAGEFLRLLRNGKDFGLQSEFRNGVAGNHFLVQRTHRLGDTARAAEPRILQAAL